MSVEDVYFLRHGETKMNREFRCQGKIDIPLNEEGLRQAAGAAEKLKQVPISAIYASPLKRAVQSAEPISRLKRIPVGTLEWLTEIDHGKVEGMNSAEAEVAFPDLLEIWKNAPDKPDFPGGENLEKVAGRVRAGLLELCENGPGGTVLLVTHQVITGVAKCLLLGLPLSRMWEDKLVNGDFLRFDITSEKLERLKKK